MLWAAVALAACAPRAPVKRADSSRPSTQASQCQPLDGGPPIQTLRDVMQRALNPRLSQISLLLFHDGREVSSDERNEELARHAGSLASCFQLAAQFNPREAESRRDFEIFTTLGHHNAISLVHSSYQRDRRDQEHWFSHIKETCQACHEQYRFRRTASGAAP